MTEWWRDEWKGTPRPYFRNVTEWWRDEWKDLPSTFPLHDFILSTDMIGESIRWENIVMILIHLKKKHSEVLIIIIFRRNLRQAKNL